VWGAHAPLSFVLVLVDGTVHVRGSYRLLVIDCFAYRRQHVLLRAGPLYDCAIAEVLALLYKRSNAILLWNPIVVGKGKKLVRHRGFSILSDVTLESA
jgi:hypothetical protein